jgi:hypothetical protein
VFTGVAAEKESEETKEEDMGDLSRILIITMRARWQLVIH